MKYSYSVIHSILSNNISFDITASLVQGDLSKVKMKENNEKKKKERNIKYQQNIRTNNRF